DPGGEVEVHEGVDRALGRRLDVDEPVVRADLEVLAAVLVGERAAEDAEPPDARGQRHGAGHLRAGAPDGLDDLRRRAVEAPVIERLQLDADTRGRHGLLEDLGDDARPHGTPTLTDRETKRSEERPVGTESHRTWTANE